MFTAARTSVLSWLGIIGGVLTIFSNLQGVLDLSRWAQWLADVWAYYAVGFLRATFGFVGIRVDASSSMMICMAAFVALIAAGARLENDYWSVQHEPWPITYRRVLNWRVAVAFAIYLSLSYLTYYAYFIPGLREAYIQHPTILLVTAYVIYIVAILVGLSGWPLPLAFVVALSMALLSYLFANAPMRHVIDADLSEDISEALAVGCAVLSGLAVLVVAPPRAFCRRLIYMLVGVFFMIALSQLSSLNISSSAPPVL